MKSLPKRAAALLPFRWQQELKRLYFGLQIKANRFVDDEQEYALLEDLVSEGDWVLDVGANVGHYTARLSELVGIPGRVIAFEPVPETFELLTANAALMKCQNVSLLNVAVSESSALAGMTVPQFDHGLKNYYEARLTSREPHFHVLCISLDSLSLPRRVTLAKIDTEGQELSTLKGMRDLLRRDRPTLIVEDNAPQVISFLKGFGYSSDKLPGSSNRLFYGK